MQKYLKGNLLSIEQKSRKRELSVSESNYADKLVL